MLFRSNTVQNVGNDLRLDIIVLLSGWVRWVSGWFGEFSELIGCVE